MSGLKIKLIILLITYIAGFVTAVYLFTPGSKQNGITVQAGSDQTFTTNCFVRSLNTGLREAVAVTKSATQNASSYIQQRLNDSNQIQK